MSFWSTRESQVFEVVSSLWGFQLTICVHFSQFSCLPHVRLNLSFVVWSPSKHMMNSSAQLAKIIFMKISSAFTTSSLVQTMSSAPSFQIPSSYVLPIIWTTKFHVHTKQRVMVCSNFRVSKQEARKDILNIMIFSGVYSCTLRMEVTGF
jgi:hypothetical protein